jgi:hypothetical protein
MRTLRGVAFLGIFGLLSLGFGCAHTIPLKPTVEPVPVLSKIPTAVGIYYTSEFRSYKHEGFRGGDKWIFALGEASAKLFDQAFPQLFAAVLSVKQRPPFDTTRPGITAVIEPKIESFDFALPMLKTGAYTANITYRFTLHSIQGNPVASWPVQGNGIQHGKIGFEFSRWPGEAADLAMQDAATKFLAGFRDVPEVRRWLLRAGVSAGGEMTDKFQALSIRR